MIDSNLHKTSKIERKLGDSLELRCIAEAIPKAKVEWYKDNIRIERNVSNDMEVLIIPYLRPEDEGQYECVVSNRLGLIKEHVSVKITSMYNKSF